MQITQKRALALLEYRDGILYRKVTTSSRSVSGSVAGYLHKCGYWQVCIDGKSYWTHRIVFLMHFGWLPERIDHRDCNKSNNRIENLRDATNPQNMFNRGKQANNKTGFKGVSFNKQCGKWTAQINVNGRGIYLGRFTTPEQASNTYVQASKNLHGEFSRY